MANEAVYPNKGYWAVRRHFAEAAEAAAKPTPWYPHHGSFIYDEPDPTAP